MDFTNLINNNIDLVVNVVAAMLGISFPFLLQAINNIDEKYNSQSIISWFSKRTSYILFKQILFVSVAVLFLLIVLPFAGVENKYNTVLQTLENILVIALVIDLFVLARDIMSFYRADKLAGKFTEKGEYLYRFSQNKIVSNIPRLQSCLMKKYQEDSEGLMVEAWSEFMSYLIKNDNGKIATTAYQYLAVRIQRIRFHAAKDVKYNDSINKAMVKLNSDICKSQIKAFSIFSSNDVLTIYSGKYDDKVNDGSIRDTVWRCLMEEIYYGRDELIYDHWSFATQRLTLFMKEFRREEDDAYSHYIQKYKEFYIVLCAILLGNGKNELLSRLLFFSHSNQGDYPLIPNTLSEILEWYAYFSRTQYEDNFAIETCYPIFNLMKSPFAGDQRLYCLEYLALLIIRLEYVRNRLYGQNRFNQPLIEAKTPAGIKRKIDNTESLIARVEKWKGERNTDLQGLLAEGCRSECDSLIELSKYRDILLSRQKDIKDNQPDSPEMIKEMQVVVCKRVEDRLALYSPLLNSKVEIPEHDETQIQDMFFKRIAYNDSSLFQLFPKGYFKDGQEVPICGLPETLADTVCEELSRGITMQFLYYDHSSLAIHYDELEKAFNMLKPNKDKHIILFFGMSSSLEMTFKSKCVREDSHYSVDGVETWILPYSPLYRNKMLIIDKSYIPRLSVVPAKQDREDKYGLVAISSKYPLMWSLMDPLVKDDIKHELLKNNKEEVLKEYSLLYIFLRYKMYMPDECIIRSISVCDPYSSEVSKLNELKTIE